MEEYDDDRDCNTTLRLGLNHDNGHQKHDHTFLESSSSFKTRDNEKERRQKEEEIDFFGDFNRKKLRLNKDQTALLEDSFKQHSTLDTTQKQALAEKLCLKPRQVEVWFQNRRARSKLKQTEVEWQLLKRNCEILSEENCRLRRELVDLRSKMKIQQWRCSFHAPKVVKPERCRSTED